MFLLTSRLFSLFSSSLVVFSLVFLQSSSSLRLLLVLCSLVQVFSRVFLRIHVPFQGCSIFVTFYPLFFFSTVVLFGLL